MIFSNPLHRSRNSGVALLITLATLLILTVIVVTYATVVRMEAGSARSSFELERARLLALSAIDDSMSKLKDNIPTSSLWAAGPGRLYAMNGNTWVLTELHSGKAQASTTGSIALNGPSLSSAANGLISTNAEYSNPDPMSVAWINVLKDGTRSTNSANATAANPIVGRYAYWVDTETSKVNLNTAGKGQTDYVITSFDPPPVNSDIQNLTAHPSRVDLSQLDGVSPDVSLATYNFAASGIWFGGDGSDNKLGGLQQTPNCRIIGQGMNAFNSLEDWAQISGVTPSTIDANRFYITTQANSPELNPWGVNKLWWQSSGGPQLAPNASQPTWAESLRGNRLNFANAKPFPATWGANTIDSSVSWGATRTGNYGDSRYFAYPPVVAVGSDVKNMQHMGWLMGSQAKDKNTSMQNWIDNIMALMSRSDWPGMPAKSFLDKYGREECESLAVNMLSLFQASAGNLGFAPFVVYSTVTGTADSAGIYGSRLVKYTRADGSVRLLSGIGPWPYLNEVAVSLLPTKYPQNSTGKFVKDKNGPGNPASIPNADSTHINIQIKVDTEQVYPPSLAWNNGWRTYQSNGGSGKLGYTNMEVNASGTYNGLPVTYGCDGQAAPQPTWEKPAGETTSQYTWGYPDDTNMWGYGYTYPANSGPNADGTSWISPSNTPIQRNLPTMYVGPFDKNSPVTVEVKLRLFTTRMAMNTSSPAVQVVPAVSDFTDAPDDLTKPTKLAFKFANYIPNGLSPSPVKSLELCDPRVYRYASDWQPCTSLLGSTLGAANSVYRLKFMDPLTGIEGDASKLAWPNIGASTRVLNYQFSPLGSANTDPRAIQTSSSITGFPGIGWLSVLPTNVESGGAWSGVVRTPRPAVGAPGDANYLAAGVPIPWRTLSLEPAKVSLEPAKGDQLPDWLLLDIFAIAYEKTFLSQTQGKININASIEPFGFNRLAPLKALMIPSSANPTTSASTIADELANYTGTQAISGSKLPFDMYVYTGQVCQLPSMAGTGDSQFKREALMRDVAGLITTKSSDFKVNVVAQSLVPNKANPSQPGRVTAEQRVEAVISRVVDVGPDNVPGTADDMAGPDGIVGTADDLKFKAWNDGVGVKSISKLTYNGTDTPLEGFAGTPPVRYKLTHFKSLNP